MNILFYCSEYPPFTTGGIGSVTKIVAELLVKRGHKVFVVGYYPDVQNLPEDSVVNGVRVLRLHKRFRDNCLATRFIQVLSKLGCSKPIVQSELTYTELFIEQLIKEQGIDIVELTDYYSFNWQAKSLKYRRFPVPTVLRIHGCCSFILEGKGFDNTAAKINDQHHFNRCDYISAVSQYSLDYIYRNFSTNHFKKKIVIYNPIEDSFLSASSEADKNVILFVGKLTETKGCYSLLKAFNLLAGKYPDLEVRMAGNGDKATALSFVAPEYQERVKFLGFCSRQQIQQEIDRCGFACIPTYFENFSMVALEILGRGKALIYTERTSGKEIIQDGENGLLVNPEDIGQIKDKIEMLITDNSVRHRLSDNGFNTVKTKFVASRIVSELEKFYSEIIIKNDCQC